ncbi:MAG: hypothetical protein NXI09_15810 [Bacteroidetes bacterium]|nr:hypothetical protein [Bacteroidota bacterium]
MNNPSDSIYGFVNAKGFRKVLKIDAPVLSILLKSTLPNTKPEELQGID